MRAYSAEIEGAFSGVCIIDLVVEYVVAIDVTRV